MFGVPPIGCLPISRTIAGGVLRDCAKTFNEAAQIYNTILSSKLATLGQSLPQSKVIYGDFYNPVLDILQNPRNYGNMYMRLRIHKYTCTHTQCMHIDTYFLLHAYMYHVCIYGTHELCVNLFQDLILWIEVVVALEL